jgi:hypothetical protein
MTGDMISNARTATLLLFAMPDRKKESSGKPLNKAIVDLRTASYSSKIFSILLHWLLNTLHNRLVKTGRTVLSFLQNAMPCKYKFFRHR